MLTISLSLSLCVRKVRTQMSTPSYSKHAAALEQCMCMQYDVVPLILCSGKSFARTLACLACDFDEATTELDVLRPPFAGDAPARMSPETIAPPLAWVNCSLRGCNAVYEGRVEGGREKGGQQRHNIGAYIGVESREDDRSLDWKNLGLQLFVFSLVFRSKNVSIRFFSSLLSLRWTTAWNARLT